MARTKKVKESPVIGVKVYKSEWHQVERRLETVITIESLEALYPDSTPEDLQFCLQQLIDGDDETLETVLEDDWGMGYIEFEHDYDDWWTDRKGGYEITYEMKPYKKGNDYE